MAENTRKVTRKSCQTGSNLPLVATGSNAWKPARTGMVERTGMAEESNTLKVADVQLDGRRVECLHAAQPVDCEKEIY